MNDELRAVAAESGLKPTHVQKLRWRYLESAQDHYPRWLPIPAIEMPSFDLTGKLRTEPRIRYLDTRLAADSGHTKYRSRAGAPVSVYFPPLLGSKTSWQKVASDPAQPIVITEGEKKAASSTAHGFPCLGLQGVDCFTHSISGELHPDLSQIEWSGRRVYVAYDNDVADKKEVRSAMRRLAGLLFRRGARVYAVDLGSGDAGKVGLDDFIVARGRKALADALDQSTEIIPHTQLEKLDQQYVLVEHPLSIRHITHLDRTYRVGSADFDVLHNDPVQTINPTTGRVVSIPVGELWRKHYPERPTVSGCVYEPNKPRIYDGNLNLWPGWGVEPKRGSTAVWRKLLKGVFGGRQDLIDWFEQWLAYPIQNPGAKLLTAVYVWGGGQGTGKSSVGEYVRRIYGAGGLTLSDNELTEQFNSWVEYAGFAIVDDLSAENPKLLRSKLKLLITSQTVPMRRMYQDTVQVANHCQFYFTSNSITSIPLDEAGNRRFFVVEAPKHPPYEIDWFTGTMDKDLHGDGPAHVMYRLLHEIDVSNFNPLASAPDTPDRHDAVESSAPEVAVWLTDLARDPTGWLVEHKLPHEVDVLTTNQLAKLASRDLGRPVSMRAVSIPAKGALVKLGQSPPFPDGARPVLWAVRNARKYKGNLAKARDHFLQHFPPA